jgi:hypothetical protein
MRGCREIPESLLCCVRASSAHGDALVATPSYTSGRVKSKTQTLAELKEENDWKNDLVLFWVPQAIR